MAARGRVDVHDLGTQVVAVFFLEHLFNPLGDIAAVGMTDQHAVILDVLAELIDIADQAFHRLDSALFLADGDHLALLVHIDDGTDAQEGAHRARDTGHTAAVLEEFKVIGKEITANLVHLGLSPFEHLFGRFARLIQITDLLDGHQGAQGDAHRVNLIKLAIGVLLQQLLDGDIHVVKCRGHIAGEMDVQNIVALFEVRLKILLVLLGGDRRGVRQYAAAQFVIERVRVKGLKILIGVGRHAVNGIRHADHMVAEFLRFGRGQIGIGIGE